MLVHLHLARRRNDATGAPARKKTRRFAAFLAFIMLSIVAAAALVALLINSPRPSTKWVAGPLIHSSRIAYALPLLLFGLLFLARRRLFAYFAVICLALAILSITLWARSYRQAEWLERRTESPGTAEIARSVVRAVWNAGGIRLTVVSSPWPLPPPPKIASPIDTGWYFNTDSDPRDYASDFFVPVNDWTAWGFSFYSETAPIVAHSPTDRTFHLIMPFWALTLILLILPFVWLLKTYRRMMRTARNLCPRCAYDLRATPDRCPECGAVQA
jgi:hypothetical protein